MENVLILGFQSFLGAGSGSLQFLKNLLYLSMHIYCIFNRESGILSL